MLLFKYPFWAERDHIRFCPKGGNCQFVLLLEKNLSINHEVEVLAKHRWNNWVQIGNWPE